MKNAIAAFALVLTLFVSPAFATQATAPADTPSGASVFLLWLPMLGLIVVWYVFMVWMKKGSGGVYDRQVKLAEENNALLKEILEVLKRKA